VLDQNKSESIISVCMVLVRVSCLVLGLAATGNVLKLG